MLHVFYPNKKIPNIRHIVRGILVKNVLFCKSLWDREKTKISGSQHWKFRLSIKECDYNH